MVPNPYLPLTWRRKKLKKKTKTKIATHIFKGDMWEPLHYLHKKKTEILNDQNNPLTEEPYSRNISQTCWAQVRSGKDNK